MPSEAPLCEYDRCEERAAGSVHAQWTVVDYLAFDTCAAHWRDLFEILQGQLFDGEGPKDMWTVWWDKGGDYVDEAPPNAVKP